MNKITEILLKILTGFKDEFAGAYNIRENGLCAARQSSPNIRITVKTDEPGLDIRIDSRARGETVYIPACVTQGGVDDLVYNDFYVDAGADVIIVAGCGVPTDGAEDAAHNGIHRFFLENGSRVIYREKHVGTGTGSGLKRIDPVTFAVLGPGSALEMDTVQLGGVDRLSLIHIYIANGLNGKLAVDAVVFDGILNLAGEHGIGPVSYTHLDVYKRQVGGQPLRQPAVEGP